MPYHSSQMIQQAIEAAKAGELTEFQIVLAERCQGFASSLESNIPTDVGRSLGIEDLLQETCIRALGSIDLFEWVSVEHFDGWLNEIARNCLIDAVRSSRRRKRGGNRKRVSLSWLRIEEHLRAEDNSHRTASHVLHVQQIVSEMRDAVRQLPERERRAVLLHYLRGVEAQRAAERMGITPGAFRALLQRARQRLRGILNESAWFPRGD
jgi:RNA polymerase sigma-70 factor (ECF subfamily)